MERTLSLPDTDTDRGMFLRSSAMATISALLGTCTLPGCRASTDGSGRWGKTSADCTPEADLAILNYVLTLEHLEAAAYRSVISSGILHGTVAGYFRTFGQQEASHVSVLTDTIRNLGGTPVCARVIYDFPVFNNAREIATYFQTMEEMGVAAYCAQSARIRDPGLLATALTLHTMEVQHAAILRELDIASPT